MLCNVGGQKPKAKGVRMAQNWGQGGPPGNVAEGPATNQHEVALSFGDVFFLNNLPPGEEVLHLRRNSSKLQPAHTGHPPCPHQREQLRPPPKF